MNIELSNLVPITFCGRQGDAEGRLMRQVNDVQTIQRLHQTV